MTDGVDKPRNSMQPLNEKTVLKNPFKQFEFWFEEAKQVLERDNPDSACLSTVNANGEPDGRIVLIKEYDERGFVFYTNIESVKGMSLLATKKASLTLHWDELHRQIRIRGNVELVTDKEADAYFNSRPRGSQLGAWASRQSSTLESREVMEQEFEQVSKKYEGKEIPRPTFWSGFRVEPQQIEFWQQGDDRMHDRLLFTKDEVLGWKIDRLYP